MLKKVLAALGVITVVGAPAAIHAATRAEAGEATFAKTDELITCPLTGEEISPCCCPLNKDEPR